MTKKTFNAMAQAVCVLRNGSRTSIGLSTILDIRASTKRGAELIAKRMWRSRGELPVAGMKRRAKCVLHPSVEEV